MRVGGHEHRAGANPAGACNRWQAAGARATDRPRVRGSERPQLPVDAYDPDDRHRDQHGSRAGLLGLGRQEAARLLERTQRDEQVVADCSSLRWHSDAPMDPAGRGAGLLAQRGRRLLKPGSRERSPPARDPSLHTLEVTCRHDGRVPNLSAAAGARRRLILASGGDKAEARNRLMFFRRPARLLARRVA